MNSMGPWRTLPVIGTKAFGLLPTNSSGPSRNYLPTTLHTLAFFRVQLVASLWMFLVHGRNPY